MTNDCGLVTAATMVFRYSKTQRFPQVKIRHSINIRWRMAEPMFSTQSAR